MEDGITYGFSEHVAMTIYSGGTTELLNGIAAIELTMEERRADAARELARLVKLHLGNQGYLVASDVDHLLEEFLEAEVIK